MYKATQKLTTQKGSLSGGVLLSEKEVKAVLTKKEIEEQIKAGTLVAIVADAQPKSDAKEVKKEVKEEEETPIDKLVEIEEKSTLLVPELRRVAEHYGVVSTGTKAELLASIAEFEELLKTEELSALSDDEIDVMAKYLDIDLSLSREEKESALAI